MKTKNKAILVLSVMMLVYSITLTGCGDDNVNSATDKLDAVVAFYDVNGKLIAPLAKTTLTKSGNDFSIEANAEIPEGAVTAKVFFFDSLATAKPVMKSAKITIK